MQTCRLALRTCSDWALGSKNSRQQLFPYFPISVLGSQIPPAQNIINKNLGVMFDSNISHSDHVSHVIKSTRVHVRQLYRICTLLELKTSAILANALVNIRLDYYYSLFVSLSDFEFRRLQHIQNSLCRVVTPLRFNTSPLN